MKILSLALVALLSHSGLAAFGSDETIISTAQKNIDYVGDGNPAHKLDLYAPEGAGPRPLAIWIHGGAWRAGSKDSVPILPLLERGWAVASVEYRLSPEAPFPAQMHDIKAAIRFLRANASELGVDPASFTLLGSSAGGHLVALAGLSDGVQELEGTLGDHSQESSRVAAIVSFYGASNFRTILEQSTEHGLSVRIPALRLFIGGTPSEVPMAADMASPIHHVDADDPPILLIHGDADPQMPYAQSVELKAALDDAEVPNELITIKDGKHGGDEFYDAKRLDQVLQFLRLHAHRAPVSR